MDEFSANGRLQISQAEHFFPSEVEFEKSVLLTSERSDWLTHPIGQVKFVLLDGKFTLLAGPALDLSQQCIGVEHLLQLSSLSAQQTLHLDLHTDISLHGDFSPLHAESDHFLIEVQISQKSSVVFLVEQSVGGQVAEAMLAWGDVFGEDEEIE